MAVKWLILVPAYGRDYRTPREVLTDWNRDKDFRIQDVSNPYNGRMVNRQDAENQADLSGTTFQIYFNRLITFCLIRKVGGEWKVVGKEVE